MTMYVKLVVGESVSVRLSVTGVSVKLSVAVGGKMLVGDMVCQ